MPSVVFVMELKSIEYIRGCRRRLHALTVARVVVIERTVTSLSIYGNVTCQDGCCSFHIRYCLRIGWWVECEWYLTVMVAMIKECFRVVDLLTSYNSQNWLPLAVEVARRF